MKRVQRHSNMSINLKFSETGLYIFNYISTQYNYPFPIPSTQTSTTQDAGLLMDNIARRQYGEKNMSPFIMKWYEVKTNYTEDYELSPTVLRIIGDMIYSMYKDKWDKLIALIDTEYDPIHNYLDEWSDSSNGMESSERDLSSTRTDTLNTTETTNSTRTDNLLRTNTINESEATTGSQNDAIYGFNSTQSSPSDTSATTGSKTNTGTDTEANTGTQGVTQTVDDTGSNTRTLREDDDVLRSDNRTRQGSHSGNIGNITTQKMIKEEIELRQWNIVNQMIRDVIDLVTLPIYLNEWFLPEPGTYSN